MPRAAESSLLGPWLLALAEGAKVLSGELGGLDCGGVVTQADSDKRNKSAPNGKAYFDVSMPKCVPAYKKITLKLLEIIAQHTPPPHLTHYLKDT